MSVVQSRTDNRITVLGLFLIALPILSFAISVWSWLRFGVDIPVYDDWRQYNANDMGRLDLNYLLTPHNDTLYTFGLFLDSIAFRLLDGNTVVYQFLSMISVLGGLVLLQWKLLKRYATDKNSLAIAFSFTLLMLQPDTYWGWQNLAYHQAIPLVCVLGIFTIATSKRFNTNVASLMAVVLGFISGLSYISGAFSALALCITFMLYGLISNHPRRQHFLSISFALAIPAILTTAAQLWVIVGVQHGTHRADAPMAYPWEADFWLFMLGKIARSLMLPMNHPTFSLVVTVAATLILAAVLVKSVHTVSKKEPTQNTEPLFIFISLSAIVFVYLLLISAGRTNLRPDTANSAIDIFSYGFYRFHFFWVTLLWPWLAYILLNWINKKQKTSSLQSFTAIAAVLLWSIAIFYTPIMSNSDFYKSTMKQRSDGMNCIIEHIQSPGPVKCSNIDLGDIETGIKNGRNANASFARNLYILPVPFGTNSPKPDYRLSEDLGNLVMVNAKKTSSDSSLVLKTENDPNITFKTVNDLSNCAVLNLSTVVVSPNNSVAQVFYLVPGDAGYNEAHSATTNVVGSTEPQRLNFLINSTSGFERQLRFDPVTGSQDLKIIDLEVRCRSFLNAN
ncbi:hypothetical protein [Pseudomonas syringae group genomosp. 3]|uniref:hypothetical protein n=1 Tax=Pseudomonas syringae group genomosp. 3 TaxID=251701 RepID=UPI001908152C|nr:hypothetical protein [Pseudomonas syringae group genomosp. 3]QQN26427.1 hypothetical protein JHZ65_22730 [Pseudomonas syringae pv. maculicola]